ncbi:hypothetical protein D3C87_1326880 [compost metagenome]
MVEPLNPFSTHQEALSAHQGGRKDHAGVSGGIDGEREFGLDADLVGIAQARLGDAVERLVAHVGQPEIGQPGDRNAQQRNAGLLERDRIVLGVLDDSSGTDRPADALTLGSDALAAGGVLRVGEDGIEHLVEFGAVCRDARTVIGGQCHAVEHGPLEATGQVQRVAARGIARRIGDGRVADQLHGPFSAPIDQFSTGQYVAAHFQHDVAPGSNDITDGVENQFLGLDFRGG